MLRRVSQLFVAPLIASLLFAVPARAADHVVSGADVSTRLGEAAAARPAHLAELNAFFASPVGLQAARVVGVDTAKVQARLAHLSDAEAADLAGRARTLTADPESGLSRGAIIAIAVGGGVTLLLLAILLALEDDDLYYYY